MRRATCLVALLAVTACSEPLELADWLLEVPEGTPTRNYAHVPREERDPEAITLVEDLLVGADLSDPEAGVFDPSRIVASPAGSIFVSDVAMNHIQMYGPDGEYLKTLGREGQGPGEFQWLWGMTIAGDHLVVDDRGNNRFSMWTLAGEHVEDHAKPSRLVHSSMEGLNDGTFVSRFRRQTMEDGRLVVARQSLDGRELLRFADFDIGPSVRPEPDWDAYDMMRARVGLYEQPQAILTVGGGETVYLSPAREYQVLALSMDGTALWALRTDMRRPPFPQAVKEAELERVTEGAVGISINDVDWPESYRSVQYLRIDGAGRLYVFLEPGLPFPERPEVWEVDVYSPLGERLAAGFLPEVWSYARGDHVFGIRTDPETEERVAVRYRLSVSGTR